MEKDDLEKVNCLRGRLIAERAASKLAKLEANQMECKVGELETQLKSEIKSRKRADKKLKFLIRKLHSLNIPYFSKYLEKSDMSSVSSSVSSTLTQVEDKDPKALTKTDENDENEELEKKSQKGHRDFEDYVSESSTPNESSADPTEFEACQICDNANVDCHSSSMLRSFDQKDDANEKHSKQTQGESQSRPIKEDIHYLKKDNSEESNENSPNIDDPSFCSSRDAVEEENDTKGKNNEARDDYVDESLALVVVDLSKETTQISIDPLILDKNVKQVLNALSHAKQRLLLSMERRHMIRVGSR